jgi:VCBS repeat-containing protein
MVEMATNTGGGTTASLSNTPQAQDDTFVLPEDYTGVKWLDVMSNDLGGNAKVLWSLDDGLGSPTDLITSDIGKVESTSCDTSANGAKIWISDGKVGYDVNTLSASFKANVQALAVGECTFDTFTYAIRLANGTLSWATAKIVFAGSNDGPIISASGTDKASVCLTETDAPLSASGTLTVVDPDTSDTVAVSVTGLTASGNVGTLDNDTLKHMLTLAESSLPADAGSSHNLHWNFASNPTTFDYLAAGECLILTYTVKGDDGHGGVTTQTVTVKIDGTNDAPVANADTGNAGENEGKAFSVVANDTDVDHNAVLALSSVGAVTVDGHAATVAQAGTFTVSGNNIQFTPGTAFDYLAVGESATVVVSYTVVDEHGASSSSTLTVTVTGANDAPVAAAISQDASEDGPAVTLTAIFTDADNSDTHTFSIDTAGTVGNVTNNSDGTFSYDPNGQFEYLAAGETATDTFSYTVNDGHGGTSTKTATVTIHGQNDAPVAHSDTGGAAENESKAFSVVANDTDADHNAVLTLTSIDGVTVDGHPASAGEASAFTVSGNDVQFTPGTAFDHLAVGESATVVVSYTIKDDHGEPAGSTLTITVTGTNDAPVAQAVGADADEDGPAVPISADFTDADTSDTHTFTIDTTGTLGSVTNNGDGTFSYDPNGKFEGLAVGETANDTFSYTVDDGHGGTSTETVTVTIHGQNDKPVAEAVAADANEDGPAVPISADFSDPDTNDTHSFSIDTTGTLGSVTNNNDGTFSYDPNGKFDSLADGETTTDTFSYTVDDGHGGTSTATVTVTIHGQNDAPTASATNSVTTDEDTASSAVAIGATDVDDDAVLNYALKSGGSPAHGSVSFDQDAGTFVYTPSANYHGDDSFTVVVTDNHGATTEQVVSVTVNSVNDNPVPTNDVASTAEDTAVTFDVLANDSDVDGDALAVTAINGTAITVGNPMAITGGSISLGADGQLTYTPTANFNGTPSFSYTVSDGQGGTATATANLTVNAVNDAPVSAGGSGSTDEDNALNASLPGATDVDGDSVGYALDTQAAHGTAMVNADGTFTYTPNSNFNGSDSFKFTVSDGHGGSNTYSYDVTVNPVNDGPTAANDVASTNEDTAVTFDVRTNDSDVDGDSLAVTKINGNAISVGNPVAITGGSISLGADGQLTYTPTANFNGTPSFSYTISDGHGGTATATVNLTVNAVADVAVIGGVDTGSVTEDDAAHTVASGALTVSDPDAGQNSFIVQSNVGGTYGSFSVDASGNWTYTLNNADPETNALNNGDVRTETFTVHSADGTAHDVNVTVNGHTDVTGITVPATFTGTGDPNDFDSMGNPAGQNISSAATNGADTLYGGAGNDTINGGGGDDIIYGGSGNDALGGAADGDHLYGGSGNDTITGGNDDDFLIGGYGADTLTGGNGNDTFVYLDLKDTNDTITDFTTGDHIDLHALDADGVLAGNQDFAFGGTTATAHGVWYAQVGGNTVIYVDTDGNTSTAELAITLTGAHTMSASDFVL